jgi:hypothetical protein
VMTICVQGGEEVYSSPDRSPPPSHAAVRGLSLRTKHTHTHTHKNDRERQRERERARARSFRVTLLCLPHGVPTNPTVRGVWEHQLFVVFVETATVSLDLILVFCVCLCLCLWLCLREKTASVRVCVCVSVSQYMFESQRV